MMTHPDHTDLFSRALSEISPARIVKADAARLRYERRQVRLARRQRELAALRAQSTVDPVTRALAKALADAGDFPSA